MMRQKPKPESQNLANPTWSLGHKTDVGIAPSSQAFVSIRESLILSAACFLGHGSTSG